MPDKERYFIGPGLAERLKETITRVGGMADGRASDEVPTRLQTMQRPSSSSTAFRIGTFTGAWNKGSFKLVTFANVATTPNTASALNLFASVPTPPGTASCAIAKEGANWYLVAAEC